MTNVATIDLLNVEPRPRRDRAQKRPRPDNRAPLRGIATAPDRLRAVGIADYVGFQALLILMQENDHAWARESRAHNGS